ncbi:MAG: recombinase family protein [Methyloceanibacter sp.]
MNRVIAWTLGPREGFAGEAIQWARRFGFRLVAVIVEDPIRLNLKDAFGKPKSTWTARIAGELDKSRELTGILLSDGAFEHPELPGLAGYVEARSLQVFSLSGAELSKLSQKHSPKGAAQNRLEGRRARAREGHHLSGPPPFGYWRAPGSSRLVIRREEALIVRRIFADYRKLKSLKKIAAILNSEGLRTRRGSLWSRAGLRHILGNKVYLGQSRFEEIEREHAHQAIVAPIMFHLAAKILRENAKRGSHDD